MQKVVPKSYIQRGEVLKCSVDIAADAGGGGKSSIFQKDFLFLFIFFSEDFREFLKKDLIEVSSLIQLEQCGRLNWWAETGTCQRLWPIGKNFLVYQYYYLLNQGAGRDALTVHTLQK